MEETQRKNKMKRPREEIIYYKKDKINTMNIFN
jgi:hypothetical protein